MTQAHPGNQVRVAAAILLAPVGGRTLEPILPQQSLSDVSNREAVNRRPIFCVLTLKAEPDYPSGSMLGLGVLGEKEVEIGDEHSWDIQGADSSHLPLCGHMLPPASSGEGEKAGSQTTALKTFNDFFLALS